jgi:hypothetical protein
MNRPTNIYTGTYFHPVTSISSGTQMINWIPSGLSFASGDIFHILSLSVVNTSNEMYRFECYNFLTTSPYTIFRHTESSQVFAKSTTVIRSTESRFSYPDASATTMQFQLFRSNNLAGHQPYQSGQCVVNLTWMVEKY